MAKRKRTGSASSTRSTELQVTLGRNSDETQIDLNFTKDKAEELVKLKIDPIRLPEFPGMSENDRLLAFSDMILNNKCKACGHRFEIVEVDDEFKKSNIY